jgi:hypothetical protein
MNTDVVIPFVEGPDDSLELRMALRSIDKNVKGNVVVWLVGQAPKWVKDVRHVVVKREKRNRFQKFHDLNRKIEIVCSIEEVGQWFIYTYDDIYFLNEADIEFLKKPRSSHDTDKDDRWLTKNDASKRWKDCMKQTLATLKKENLPVYNYETHMPRVFNKEKALTLLTKYDHQNFAFQFATMYFNNFYSERIMLSDEPDFKLAAKGHVSVDVLKEKAKTIKFLNANIYRRDVMKMLKEMWPEKGRFEK